MTNADELMASVLRRSLRPLSEMPAVERMLMTALLHGGLSKNRRAMILSALCKAQAATPAPAPAPTRPLERYTTEDLLNEIAVYRHDLSDLSRAVIKLLAKR